MSADPTEARKWLFGGRVQGVGFRPFVHRTAQRHRLQGWVRNTAGQVEILASGQPDDLTRFGSALLTEAPSFAEPRMVSSETTAPPDCTGFTILPSRADAPGQLELPPDQATCADCLAELRDPANRRYRYPFLSCTQCGPRYTLIRSLPYDRPNTTQLHFPLCPRCAAEYTDPSDRRFHAETTACPDCGPRLEFRADSTACFAEPALQAALAALRAGRIVAVKGIGGYHLMCDAGNAEAVARLRDRKHRPHKPLAVMFPDEPAVARAAILDPAAAEALRGPTSPIVLLPRRHNIAIADAVAPGCRDIGVMLPYSPLHHLLLDDFAAPLVATSGNISGEPVLTDNHDAQTRLAGIADAFLHHDRPIARPADDPVLRPIAGRLRPMRLGRGTAPLELTLPRALSRPVLALGAQGKNTIALGWGQRAVISPHLGDMDTPRSVVLLRQIAGELQDLHGVRAEAVACDAHPGYTTTRLAREFGLPVMRVPHHHAHAAALAAEYDSRDPWLVFTWDGAGFGADGTIWGGEALLGRPGAWRSAASLRSFALPGGERAALEPWRSALAVCWEIGTQWAVPGRDVHILRHAWERRVNCPRTSSAGRLFDAAAALLGVVETASHEAHAPMLLEAACITRADPLRLPLARRNDGVWITDWAPLIEHLAQSAPTVMPGEGPASTTYLDDPTKTANASPSPGMTTGQHAELFHATLAGVVHDQAIALRTEHGSIQIGLTGGVFQNRILAEHTLDLLCDAGFTVHLPARLPTNDAAISFGQLVEAACQ